jgi:hypothetical protein
MDDRLDIGQTLARDVRDQPVWGGNMGDAPGIHKRWRIWRVRFTIASLMIAVAVTGTALGTVMERRSRFLRIAEQHRSQIVGAQEVLALGRDRICRRYWMDAKGNVVSATQAAKDNWHSRMSEKYLFAASQP